MALAKRTARLLHPIAAGAIVLLVFVQVYLIADFIFGNAGVLNAHMTVGRIVIALELLVLATALIGWWGDRREVGISAGLVVLGALQALLAKDLGDTPQVHAFHGMLALAVFALAWAILLRTRGEVQTRGA
jgi:hypothetical protein